MLFLSHKFSHAIICLFSFITMSERLPQTTPSPEQKKRLIKTVDESGSYPKTTTYEYDTQGRVSKKIHDFGGRALFETRYSYDTQGRLTREESINERGWRLSEPLEAQRKKQQTSVQIRSTEHLYNDHAQEPVLTMYMESNRVISTTENILDAQGRVIEARETRGSSEEVQQLQFFSYDEQGRMTRQRILNRASTDAPDAPPSNGYDHAFSYDAQGRTQKATRSYAGSQEPFGSIEYTYSKDGKTKKQRNTYYGQPIWEITETLDEAGNVKKQTFTHLDRSEFGTSTTQYKHTYE